MPGERPEQIRGRALLLDLSAARAGFVCNVGQPVGAIECGILGRAEIGELGDLLFSESLRRQAASLSGGILFADGVRKLNIMLFCHGENS